MYTTIGDTLDPSVKQRVCVQSFEPYLVTSSNIIKCTTVSSSSFLLSSTCGRHFILLNQVRGFEVLQCKIQANNKSLKD